VSCFYSSAFDARGMLDFVQARIEQTTLSGPIRGPPTSVTHQAESELPARRGAIKLRSVSTFMLLVHIL